LAASAHPPNIRAGIAELGGVPKLFIAGRDSPDLMVTTEYLYQQAPQPKQMLIQEHTQLIFANESEKREYENAVLDFFLHNLPQRAD